ncbi:MAG: aspartate aminotransferase family protein [Chloroflexi bacterium]|nr:aspartate aminotransferase family protein [Chloroflexota bacterium]
MSTDWKSMENKYYMFAARRQPIVLVRGEGTKLWDENGKEYLDFIAGWAVNNLGHCHPVIVEAVAQQARRLMQTSNQFYTIPQLQLAQLLVENSCLDKVFFCNSGAEANEGAVKLARKYGKMYRNNAYEIITALNSFHGRTLAMVSATGQPHYQDTYLPIPEGFVNVAYNDIDAIRAATTEKTVAVMLEVIQGEGGVNLPSPGYVKQVRRWCDEEGLLLILDEVQTGLGRLGSLFGYQLFDAEPDIMTLAKALGGGVPIGALLAKEKASVFAPGDHGSTFGGNALTCAAAYASTKFIIDHDIPAHARQMGDYLKGKLKTMQSNHEFIRDVRGMGLLIAVEFNSDMAASVVSFCNEGGLLLNPVRPNAIRIMPPLIVSPEDIDKALDILEMGLTKAARGRAS